MTTMCKKGVSFKEFKIVTLLLLCCTLGSFAVYTFSNLFPIRVGIPQVGGINTPQIDVIRNKPGLLLPHQHVYYLKTHKTASTTTYNILAEYARSHDLLALMPSNNGGHINSGGEFNENQVKIFSSIRKYDMLFSHHIYSPRIFKYLHNDTFRITSLREPFDNFISAFLYFKNRWNVLYLKKIPTTDPITEFLRHPKKYEENGYRSVTNNRQSMDMGYDMSKRFDEVAYIKEFIKLSDSRFDLVMIMEYFDESLVVLKRFLHWNTEDIIYYIEIKGEWYNTSDAKNRTDLETERRKLHAKFSQADIMLYEHFLNRFKKVMEKAEGIEEYRIVLEKVRNYCNNMRPFNQNLVIPAGKWINGFQLTRYKCKMLKNNFLGITRHLQNRQKVFDV